MPDAIERIRELTAALNRYRHEYYNLNAPTVTDADYDRLYDELSRLEKEVGFTISGSPTQTVGYAPVSSLAKVIHPIPLLSLDKTKRLEDLSRFIGNRRALLMLKLDGLTVKLEYEGGRLVRASTRGDGNRGEDVTHNALVFRNIPVSIPYTGRLVITGEAIIKTDDFERIQTENDGGTAYKTPRNLAAGSVRLFDPAVCAKRSLRFFAFGVLEGLDGDSKREKLEQLKTLGFDVCRNIRIDAEMRDTKYLGKIIGVLKARAGQLNLPIDGMVVTYDEIAYSRNLGATGHHYKDGLAFKFGDEAIETVFRGIEWTPSRSGEIAPVALFDAVDIDGTEVSRATLHNLSFIENLELRPNCRILVSKRNMIIPQVEDNLDRGGFDAGLIPLVCPCCGAPTRVDRDSLFCDNPGCESRRLRQFVHFVGEKAMNIEGLSESTLEKFIGRGWLRAFTDIYRLDKYEREIRRVDGFGEKSWTRLWSAIQKSRNTTFERFLIAMDIPMIGRAASRELRRVFSGDLDALENALEVSLDPETSSDGGYDFTQLLNFGETLNRNIHEWFRIEENRILWKELRGMLNIQNSESDAVRVSSFAGRTIVVTGTLQNFTRVSINAMIESLGAKAGSSVTKKTDYLICGESVGGKLDKARELGIPVLTERQFMDMAKEVR
jgi:DNA ligase (NAD+)